MSERSPLEDVLHRVNNLLGTIEIQAEVARAVGTPEALGEAIDHIVNSARRTREELDRVRAGGGEAGAEA